MYNHAIDNAMGSGPHGAEDSCEPRRGACSVVAISSAVTARFVTLEVHTEKADKHHEDEDIA